jgi:hypothetical protein
MKPIFVGKGDKEADTDLVTFDVTKAAVAGLPSVRLITPSYSAANSVDSTGDIAQYYSAGTKAFYTYINGGSKTSLTYMVTTNGTTPAVGQEIRLQINAPWSGSNAHWSVGDKTAGPSDGGNFGLEVSGTTNGEGKVTFEVTNTDTEGLENAPSSPTQNRDDVKPARLFGTMKPIFVGKGDKEADTDLVTFDVTKAGAPAALPSVRLITPSYTAANSVDTSGDIAQWYSKGVKAFFTYITGGSSLTLTYLVTTNGTTPAVGQELRLQINAPYSGSNAHWTIDGKTVGPQAGDQPGLDVVGTTNAEGKVTFVLKNTDTTGLENVPTSPTQKVGDIKPARLYGTMKVVIPGKGDKESDIDIATFDVTKAAVVPVVKVAQQVASVKTTMKNGSSLTLPAKSLSNIAIKWVSTTATICKVSGTKVTAKKKGTCSVTGTNAGNATKKALSVTKKIKVQ